MSGAKDLNMWVIGRPVEHISRAFSFVPLRCVSGSRQTDESESRPGVAIQLTKHAFSGFDDDDDTNSDGSVDLDYHQNMTALIETVIHEYRSIVGSSIHHHTASWFRYIGAYRVEEDDVNVEATLKTFNPRRKHRAYVETTNRTFTWDTEEDIPKYFRQLSSACAKIESSAEIYGKDCLMFMYSLVYHPRCTTRMDSRTVCRGHPQDQLSATITPFSRLENEDENTVNIVIIGGGPIGLYLANTLAQLPALHSQSLGRRGKEDRIPIPRFRIIVFENRVVAEGHKQPYTRLWGTETSGGNPGAIDHRILAVFRSFHEKGPITLPINFWETLLLLSCRDLGVTFIYGDIQDFEEELVKLDNLVMFDATGHRLQPLIRQDCKGKAASASPRFFRWKYYSKSMRDSALHRWKFPKKFIRPVAGMDSEGGYATQLEMAIQDNGAGPIIYPVLQNKKPFYLYRFDISNMNFDDEASNKLKSIVEDAKKAYNRRHGLTESSPFFQGLPVVDYTDDYNLKEEVLAHIAAISKTTFIGFEEGAFSIKPTEDQGEFLEELLRRHSKPGESSIPWSRISSSEYRGNAVLRTNRVDELLELASKYLQYDAPGVWGISASAYRSYPYIYADPLVPGGYPLAGGQRRVPLLRVGNSLFSGDTDIASGLSPQMSQVRQLQEAILDLYS
ncbi:hypothetical protein IV203_022412 [Nitzschia inconspicua]|uniref:Uncharacterized protein n=1 Tax=Nitzschia inconspicua TaxID=303405 RepID=A0A9K3KIN1_9STRA|nr:hypothetical protein IV203_022412 [Nitzschia inconspicua]